TRFSRDWSSDVCSSDLPGAPACTPAGTPAGFAAALRRLRRSSSAAEICGGKIAMALASRHEHAQRAAGGKAEHREQRQDGEVARSEERRVGKEGRARSS